MAQYKTGTASVTNGSDTVTGVGTQWLANVQVGNSFKFQGENAVYNVNAVTSDGTVKISPLYAGTSKVNAAYVIARDFTGNGLYELSAGDLDWTFFMTQNMRLIDASLGGSGISRAPSVSDYAAAGGIFYFAGSAPIPIDTYNLIHNMGFPDTQIVCQPGMGSSVSVPAAPAISATAGAGQDTVSWSAVSGAVSYNLYWTADGSTPTTASVKITGASSPYLHTGLTNGTTYKYVATSVNASGESAVSNVATATPAATTHTITLTQPAHGTIAVVGGASTVADGGSVTIAYTPSADYHITAGSANSGSVSGLTGNQFTVSNVTANVTIGASVAINTYTITTTAGSNGSITDPDPTVNYGGSQTINVTANSGYHVADVLVDGSSVGAVTTYTFSNVTANHTIAASFAINSNQLPTAPTGLTATSITSTGFTLSWTAATDPDGTVASYKVYQNGANIYTSGSTSQAISGQAAGSTATYTVSAVDNTGAEGPQSTGLSVTTIPAAPMQSALTVGNAQLTANWSDVSGEASYTVYYSTSSALTASTYDGTNAYPGTPSATAGKIAGVAANSVNQVITGLTGGTTYYVRVSALNASGESAQSAAQSGTPYIILFSDSFNDLSQWAATSGRSDDYPVITSGRVHLLSPSSTAVSAEHTFGSAIGSSTIQYDMQFDATGTFDGRIYLQAVGSTGITNNSYLIDISNSGVRILRYISGALTTLTSPAFTGDTSNHTYKIVINHTAGTITVAQEGTTLASVTDSTYSSFSKITIFSAGATPTEGTWMDNMLITSP